jgi:hypothetical protein
MNEKKVLIFHGKSKEKSDVHVSEFPDHHSHCVGHHFISELFFSRAVG